MQVAVHVCVARRELELEDGGGAAGGDGCGLQEEASVGDGLEQDIAHLPEEVGDALEGRGHAGGGEAVVSVYMYLLVILVIGM